MPATIAMALSGGIDSLVAAALLKEQGHRLIGLHFLTGYEQTATEDSQALQEQLHALARRLETPLHIIDLKTEFCNEVVDYFVRSYHCGKTPNPCLICNPRIKFDILYEKGRALGAQHIATGHYARIQQLAGGGWRLLRGKDASKDQSYFLAGLRRQQLPRIMLPLGEFSKRQVRAMAATKGLRPTQAHESQDVCFIPPSGYETFLAAQSGFRSRPGPIATVTGEVIGRHSGIYRFTIGQRRGLNCPAAAPYYVVRIEPEKDLIVVGQKSDLFSSECTVSDINWITPLTGSAPLRATVKVRYRHTAVPATVTPIEALSAKVCFDTPQAAVTPGQGAVFYQGEEVLGGGWIQ